MPRNKNTPREWEIRGRAKAFEAARLAQAENISMESAAARVGSKRSSVQEAMMILLLGTPEEIEAVEHGNVAMGITTDAIRARTAPEERKAKYRKPAYAPEVWEGREFDAQVWRTLRAALEGLTGMPAPADAVAIVRKNQMRTDFVGRKAAEAHAWLEEFINAYTS